MIAAVIPARGKVLRAFFAPMRVGRLAKILLAPLRIIKVKEETIRKVRCAAATGHRTCGDKLGQSLSVLIV